MHYSLTATLSGSSLNRLQKLTNSPQFQRLNEVSAPHTFLLSGAGFIWPKADTICSSYMVSDNKQVILERDLTHPKKGISIWSEEMCQKSAAASFLSTKGASGEQLRCRAQM